MQKPVVSIRQFLETLHFRIGQVLVLCSRTMATVAVLGVFFCLMMLGGLLMTRHPERILQMQSFHFNYNDFNRVQVETETRSKADGKTDPAWDGAVAGFGLGMETGRMIPWVGSVAGPVLGAAMGYQLDKQI